MRSLRLALALFSVAPVGLGGALRSGAAAAALRWLPWLGAALGALAGLPAAAVHAWAGGAALLGAVLSIALLALLTRGLHLDGLADTVDGLGARAPAERALEVMRRPDIGPFGVVAIALVVLVDVAAVFSLEGAPGRSVWRPVAALAVAAATGRLAALCAAHRRVRSARPVGFGTYVAGSVSTPLLAVEIAGILALGAGLAAAVGAGVAAWLVAQAAALVVCGVALWHVTRRLGGVTGDVFGALIELGTALTLAGLALA